MILTISEAAAMAAKAKSKGKKVVTANGAFDMLSYPHLQFLTAAKKEGDILLVGVNSDRSVRDLKGNKRPIVPQADRAELVSELKCVDGVFVFDETDPRAWLTLIKPNVHVNSAEYGQDCVEASVLKDIGATLVLTQRDTSHLSTSDVIKTIQERYAS
jgi:rfaE bifunctional protein nucleotidyltransferase chain/domain